MTTACKCTIQDVIDELAHGCNVVEDPKALVFVSSEGRQMSPLEALGELEKGNFCPARAFLQQWIKKEEQRAKWSLTEDKKRLHEAQLTHLYSLILVLNVQ